MKHSISKLLSLMAVAGGSAVAAPTLVNSNITSNTQWTVANSPYVLQGVIYVTGGATLDIEPGVVVRGMPISTTGATDPGSLIVARDGKIQARGTSASPIIFTTAALDAGLKAGGARNGLPYDGPDADSVPDRWTVSDGDTMWLDLTPATAPLPPVNSAGARNSGLWGGLVVLGNASTNAAYDVSLPADGVKDEGYAYLEGQNSSSLNIYGGANDLDNSGILRYLSIRHNGYTIADGKELNGLTLGGVATGTTIDHIETYCSPDHGIEIFGGTVDLSYLSIIGAEDDGLDTDQGYRGTTQYVYVAHGLVVDGVTLVSSSDPRGMELDGDDANESGNPITASGLPRQDHRIYNATVQTSGAAGGGVQAGVFFRRGFGGVLANSIIANNSGTTIAEGVVFNTNAGTGSINVQQRYADQALQVRNVTVNGFTAATTSFSATPAGGSSTSFNPGSNTGLAATVFYPATNNRTTSADMLNITYATGGLNPRPGAGPAAVPPSTLATGSTQVPAYVPAPAASTLYTGAFDQNAATLWTTGWTAANKTNVNGIKLLVD